ncbi:ribose-5-phosphate isomerase RpiA [Peribacillus sp. SCS-155]|uniref:ribose-5-phosphate isomerase RpiA n=1 Tax=Peribacillus sedimenti TaxID=3115297 RepID=UPI0039065513
MHTKQMAGEAATQYIEEGMTIGLGTGSTVYWTIKKLGKLVSEGLDISAVPTSKHTEKLANENGIPLIPLSKVTKLDVTIDGADEVNPDLDLIKGGGGALLREKIIASNSRRLIIVVDETKCVSTLGHFPLPVEIVQFGLEITIRQLQELNCNPALRLRNGDPFVTDNGNYIVDCKFDAIADPQELCKKINMIPGVIENGIFSKMADIVVVGRDHDAIDLLSR